MIIYKNKNHIIIIMADLGEAFNTLKTRKKLFYTIDYFFTQRTLTEEQEFIDTTMTRQIKKVKITHNFLALNIPTLTTLSNDGQTMEKPFGFDVKIYGDNGYHYEGTISSFEGIIPNFMIPIQEDKKIFVNIIYKFKDINNNILNKEFINFIEVPKRFQTDAE
jgi:hypothetical protein